MKNGFPDPETSIRGQATKSDVGLKQQHGCTITSYDQVLLFGQPPVMSKSSPAAVRKNGFIAVT